MSRRTSAPDARPVPREAAPSKRTAAAVPPPRLFARLWDPRAPFLLPLLALLASRLWLARQLATANEDAYITFRYAANWAAGLGPVFNPGERVLGFTSPLWTALSTLGLALHADPVVWARGFAVAGDVVALLAFGLLLERHASRAAAWMFAVAWAAYPYFAAVTASGLETGFVVALVGLTAWGADRGGRWTGWALGALALSRPEGLAMAVVLAPWVRARDRWVGGALAAAGIAALAIQFGSPVPQSMLAKASLYGTPGPWAGRQWWEWLLPFPLAADAASSEGGNLRLVGVALFAGVLAGVPALWRARRTPLAGAAAALLAVWAGYSALGVAYFHWYLVMPLAGALLVACVGLGAATRGPAVPLAFALGLVGLWTIAPRLYVGRAGIEAQVFQTMSGFFERQAKPGETLMLEPIGLIGWRNRPLRVLDEVGLVSPEVARRRREGPGWYADLLAERRPEWLLTRRGVLLRNVAFAGAGVPFRSLEERDRALADYRLVAAQDSTLGDQAWVIYRRGDATR